MKSNIKLSVVVPFKDEAENLGTLHKQILSVLNNFNFNSQIVYIDDGSIDNSFEIVEGFVKNKKNEKISLSLLRLKKNFGQTAAVSAGIDNSMGELLIFMDADLQNDPNDIPKFLEKLEEGYDAVFGWRRERRDATLRSFMSKLANSLIRVVFSYPFHDVGCSARVVKREFLTDLELYGELHRVMPVLIYLKGAKVGEIIVKHHDRKKGKSKYGFERIVKTVIDVITVKFLNSYGTKPAYVFGSIGLGSGFLSFLLLIMVAFRKLFLGVFVHRDPLFLIAIFFGLLGVQFILMGLLAELQVRTYFESQKKKIYEVKSIFKN